MENGEKKFKDYIQSTPELSERLGTLVSRLKRKLTYREGDSRRAFSKDATFHTIVLLMEHLGTDEVVRLLSPHVPRFDAAWNFEPIPELAGPPPLRDGEQTAVTSIQGVPTGEPPGTPPPVRRRKRTR